MANDLVPVGDLEKMARALSASKLFGITNVDQAMALMLVAQAEGLHPATAARDYHIIQGRPALKADAMMARYLASGGKVKWIEHTDAKVMAEFSHPAGGTLTIGWDMERAKKAGLGGKDMWAKYPRQMLRARVISEGIRATNPGIAIGIYTPEEMQDIRPDGEVTQRVEPKPRKEPKDMGRAEVVDAETGEITQAAPAMPPERAALRRTDSDAIAGCTDAAELTALVLSMKSAAKVDGKPDAERRKWIAELANARDAELTAASDTV